MDEMDEIYKNAEPIGTTVLGGGERIPATICSFVITRNGEEVYGDFEELFGTKMYPIYQYRYEKDGKVRYAKSKIGKYVTLDRIGDEIYLHVKKGKLLEFSQALLNGFALGILLTTLFLCASHIFF